jgi:hypothetical protein
MKKINVKKLNQFYLNNGNSESVKALVETCVTDFVHAEVKNPTCITILQDLNLLMDA